MKLVAVVFAAVLTIGSQQQAASPVVAHIPVPQCFPCNDEPDLPMPPTPPVPGCWPVCLQPE